VGDSQAYNDHSYEPTGAGKRAFTRDELIALFDHADEQVARIRAAGRKGWLPASSSDQRGDGSLKARQPSPLIP
jgi:hypothetical protein